MHENIGNPVGVARGEVGGGGGEGDVAAIGTERGRAAVTTRGLSATGSNADAGGGATRAVTQEDVAHGVGIAGDEVGGVGGEGDVTTVGAEDGL